MQSGGMEHYMKVVALNGSPKKQGNTYTSLNFMAEIFEENGIDYNIVHVGSKALNGCIDCGVCSKKQGECAIKNDNFNEIAESLKGANGVIFGAPVYYAGIAGNMKCFMDRFFRTNSEELNFKPVAAICALRRSGGVETFNQMNNYFSLSRSIVTPTSYWSAFHGAAAGEVAEDYEAVDCAKEIARNMCWLIDVLDKAQTPIPQNLPKRRTNFIR